MRIYERALNSSEVHAEMSAPIGSDQSASERGLVAAYALDAGSGRVARDASGNGNAGTIDGASWTTRGRFGRAVRFNGAGDIVRVPASASLNLRGAMTLSAWIRPSESQTGWRTILHRQTDAYFLTAGGGPREDLGTFDHARLSLIIIAAVWLCVALVIARAPWATGPRIVLLAAGRTVSGRVDRRCGARAVPYVDRPDPGGAVVRPDGLAPRRGGEHVPPRHRIHGADSGVPRRRPSSSHTTKAASLVRRRSGCCS